MLSRGMSSRGEPTTLAFADYKPVTGSIAKQLSSTGRTLGTMRGAARKSPVRKAPAPSMGFRIIPAALACAGFLVTFTVRSWHEGLWRPSQAADYGIVSAPRQPANSPKTSLAASAFQSAPRLASVLPQQPTRPRATPMPTATSAVAPADAAHYLAERAREAGRSGRMR